jgi:hypothetical protein
VYESLDVGAMDGSDRPFADVAITRRVNDEPAVSPVIVTVAPVLEREPTVVVAEYVYSEE